MDKEKIMEDTAYEAKNKIFARMGQEVSERREELGREMVYAEIEECCAIVTMKILESLNPYFFNQAIEHARHEMGMKWDNNRQRLSFYEKVREYMPTWIKNNEQ